MAFSADDILRKAKEQTEESKRIAAEEEKLRQENETKASQAKLDSLLNTMQDYILLIPNDKTYTKVTLHDLNDLLKKVSEIHHTSGKYENLDRYNDFLRMENELKAQLPLIQRRQKILDNKSKLTKISVISTILEVLVIVLVLLGTFVNIDTLEGIIVGGLAIIGGILGLCIGGPAGALGGLIVLGIIGLIIKAIIVSLIGRIVLFIVWTIGVSIYFILSRKKTLD